MADTIACQLPYVQPDVWGTPDAVTDTQEHAQGARAALVRRRTAVDTFTSKWLSQGNATWAEETATDLLLMAVHPELSYVAFNRYEESRVGADWLWWFVDSASHEAFGVLVQAKNLKKKGQRWHIDYDYKEGGQIRSLIDAADLLQVPAVYALYCGDPAYRQELWCGQAHDGVMCTRHPHAGVSVLPAMLAAYLGGTYPNDLAAASLHAAVPLEDLTTWENQPPFHVGVVTNDAVQDLLTRPQQGARLLAKRLLKMLTDCRKHQEGAPRDFRHSRLDLDGAVFTGGLPDDQGHYLRPHFPHVLRGMRRTLPSYVGHTLETHRLPDGPEFRDLAGMAVACV
ncbi:DUF6615 family protein [Streptomyces sp. NPDC050564]|uniref:DUF6615 family protein n=1 Tax=Streptomyces sp. NPDC050564 TaxID=3365631 RepID=UPI003799B3AF